MERMPTLVQRELSGAGISGAGTLELPANASRIVVLSCGTPPGQPPSADALIAARLRAAGFGTLLLDLPAVSGEGDAARDEVHALSHHFGRAVRRLAHDAATRHLPSGLCAAGIAAGAALWTAAEWPELVRAVVSFNGRPDLAGRGLLACVKAPTLLIAEARNSAAVDFNRAARDLLTGCVRELVLIVGFGEPRGLDEAARLACDWLVRRVR